MQALNKALSGLQQKFAAFDRAGQNISSTKSDTNLFTTHRNQIRKINYCDGK